MNKTVIEDTCKKKEKELLKKYFGNLIQEAAIERPETIGEYSIDLPLKIEAEYKAFLDELWAKEIPNDPRSIDEIIDEQKLRSLMTKDNREGVDAAYKNAMQRTLWERITQTNHKDVTFYKGLLEEYTKELLRCMRYDFLEEAAGLYITNKAFE